MELIRKRYRYGVQTLLMNMERKNLYGLHTAQDAILSEGYEFFMGDFLADFLKMVVPVRC